MKSKLAKILSYHRWRQSISLGNNLKTPGRVSEDIWNFIHLPNSLKGKSFLEVGSNDGMFSFIAEKKEASKVVSSDLYKPSYDSMRNGWSVEGINLLKDYFNSKIEIHEKGVYHLQELNEKFDVVIINDIINWLDDIELAFENLGKVVKGELYLSDGFLIDNSKPIKKKIEGQSERYMYNLKFIEDILNRNGFKVEHIKELNYQKVFVEDFVSIPLLDLNVGTKIYESPFDNQNFYLLQQFKQLKADGNINGYRHIYDLGWVKEEDVRLNYFLPSLLYNFLKFLRLESIYFNYLKKKEVKKNGFTAYSIKASKIS